MNNLSDLQCNIIMQCIIAVIDGPFLVDEEFQTRLGVARSDIRRLIGNKDILENNIFDAQDTNMIINNCLNEVSNGISCSVKEWNKWFTISKEQIKDTYSAWQKLIVK